MPIRELRIESNYVVATETVVEVVSSTDTPNDTTLALIDLPEFERLFHARHPDSLTNPKALWHMLLGNHPDLAERVSCGIRLSYKTSWREDVLNDFNRFVGDSVLRALDEAGELHELDELEICLPDGNYIYNLSAADVEKILANLKRLTTLYGDFYDWHSRERLSGDVLKRLRDLEQIALNPVVRYLSLEACEKLLTYYSRFAGGIDFEHLPAGFFLTKNPRSGVCDVLHYSDYVAAHQKDVSPFAITLPTVAEEEMDVEPWALESPQAEWYAFLHSQRGNGIHAFCSERELKNAFIAFRKCVERLGLEFYAPDFSSLTHNTNPLILLGRWETVLTNPYLKKENLNTQWLILTQLPLQRGFEAIRAITDYQYSETPCRFVIPEMSFSHDVSLQMGRLVGYHRIEAYQPIKESEQIMYCDELGERYSRQSSSFPQALLWRYLAYQPQCHSIVFYRQALAQIDGAGEPSVRGLCRILVTATTEGNYQAGREADDLADWSSLCSLIKSMFSLPTSVVSALLLAWGESEAERGRTVYEKSATTDFGKGLGR